MHSHVESMSPVRAVLRAMARRFVSDFVDYLDHNRCSSVGCPRQGLIRTWLRDEDKGPTVRLCLECFRAWKGPGGA